MAFITVETRGGGIDRLIARAERNLRQANRTVGREIVKVGGKAMRKGAPRMWGRKLAIKTKVDPAPAGVHVLFFPAPKNAGGWAMRESGTAAHKIAARNAKALHWGAGTKYATKVNHPGSTGGKAWTKAGDRLEAALNPVVQDVYDEALAD